jgi:hypothetical protein
MPPPRVEIPFNGTTADPANPNVDVLLGQPVGLYTLGGAGKYSQGQNVWFKTAGGRLRAMFTGQIRFMPQGTALPAPWSGTLSHHAIALTVRSDVMAFQSAWLPESLNTLYLLYENIDHDTTRDLVQELMRARRPTEDAAASVNLWLTSPPGDVGEVDVNPGDFVAAPALALADYPDPPTPGTRSWPASSISLRSKEGVLDLRIVLDELDRIPPAVWPSGRFTGTAALWSTFSAANAAQVAASARPSFVVKLQPAGVDIPIEMDTTLELIRAEPPNFPTVRLTFDRRAAVPGAFVVHGTFTVGDYWAEPLVGHIVLDRTPGAPASITRTPDVHVDVDNVLVAALTIRTHLPFHGLHLRRGMTTPTLPDDNDGGGTAAQYAGLPPPIDLTKHDLVQTLHEVLERFGIYMFRAQPPEEKQRFGPRVDAAVRELQATFVFPSLARERVDLTKFYPARLDPVPNTYLTDCGNPSPVETTGHLSGPTLEYLQWIIIKDLRYPRAIQERIREGNTGADWRAHGEKDRSSTDNNVWWYTDLLSGGWTHKRLFVRDVSSFYDVPADATLDLVEDGNRYHAIGFPTYFNVTEEDGSEHPVVAATTGNAIGNRLSHAQRIINTPADFGWGDHTTLAQQQTFDVISRISQEESLRAFDVVQVYDRVFASMPLYHYTLGTFDERTKTVGPGELASLLAYVRHIDLGQVYSNTVEHLSVRAYWDELPRSKGVITGFVKVKRLTSAPGVAETWSFVSLPNTEEDQRWFSCYHWFLRYIMMARASTALGVATWPTWRRAFVEMGEIRLINILRAAWPAASAGGASTNITGVQTVGAVFKSRATLTMLLRWHVKAPGHILNGDGSGYSRLRAILGQAIARSPGVNWAATSGGTPDPSLWTNVHEGHLAHAIREVANRAVVDAPGNYATKDSNVRAFLEAAWPASNNHTLPGALPADWTSRDFQIADPNLPT